MPSYDWKDPTVDSYFKTRIRDLDRSIQIANQKGAVLCGNYPWFHVPVLTDIKGVTTSYSSAFCSFGTFEKNNALSNSTFFFIPKEGEEIPEQLQKNIEPWPVLKGYVHMDEGVVRIPFNENIITFLDLDLSASVYDLLKSVNTILTEERTGCYVDTLEPVYDMTLRDKKMYPGKAIPYISNEHTRAPMTGYAIHFFEGQYFMPYAGFVAHKTISESIWASLVANKGSCRVNGNMVMPIGKVKMSMTPLRKYNRFHCAMLTNSARVGGWNPDDTHAYILSFDFNNPQLDMKNKILQKFEEIFPFPVLSEWVDPMWKYGVKQGLIKNVTFAGDCTGAIAINVRENWVDIMAQLLEKGVIRV
jgi:hypothetical protein